MESIVPFEGSKSLKKMAFLGETQEKRLVKQRRKNIDCWMEVLLQDMFVEYKFLRKRNSFDEWYQKNDQIWNSFTASPRSLTNGETNNCCKFTIIFRLD